MKKPSLILFYLLVLLWLPMVAVAQTPTFKSFDPQFFDVNEAQRRISLKPENVGAVQSVNGQTGEVTITPGGIGAAASGLNSDIVALRALRETRLQVIERTGNSPNFGLTNAVYHWTPSASGTLSPTVSDVPVGSSFRQTTVIRVLGDGVRDVNLPFASTNWVSNRSIPASGRWTDYYLTWNGAWVELQQDPAPIAVADLPQVPLAKVGEGNVTQTMMDQLAATGGEPLVTVGQTYTPTTAGLIPPPGAGAEGYIFRDGLGWGQERIEMLLQVGNETTVLTAGENKLRTRTPYGMELYDIRASLSDASTNGIVSINVLENGVAITDPTITIDPYDRTSAGATNGFSITDTLLGNNSELQVDIAGAGEGAKGLKIWLLGFRRNGIPVQLADGSAPSPEPTYLLDTLDGTPVAHYALRRVKASFSDYLITLRRAGDGATNDFFLSGSSLDTNEISGWITAGGGTQAWVTRWNDQVTGTQRIAQSVTSRQPLFYDSGFITDGNGNLGLKIGATERTLVYTISLTQPVTAFMVAASHSHNSGNILLRGGGTTRGTIKQSGTSSTRTYRINSGADLTITLPSVYTYGDFDYFEAIFNGSSSVFRVNDTETPPGSAGANDITSVGIGDTTVSADATITEVIWWSGQPTSSDRDKIRTDLKDTFQTH
jgi:hypothetical protein